MSNTSFRHHPDSSFVEDDHDWAAFKVLFAPTNEWIAEFCRLWSQQTLGGPSYGPPQLRWQGNTTLLVDLHDRMDTMYPSGQTVIDYYMAELLKYKEATTKNIDKRIEDRKNAEDRKRNQQIERLLKLHSLRQTLEAVTSEDPFQKKSTNINDREQVLQYSIEADPGQPHPNGTVRVIMYDGIVQTHQMLDNEWLELITSAETERLLWNTIRHLKNVQGAEVSLKSAFKLEFHTCTLDNQHVAVAQWYRSNDVGEWVRTGPGLVHLEARCQLLAQLALAFKQTGRL